MTDHCRHPTATVENVSAPKPNHTFSILEFLLADGARPVITIKNHRSFGLWDGACCVGRWTGVVRVRILRVQRIERRPFEVRKWSFKPAITVALGRIEIARCSDWGSTSRTFSLLGRRNWNTTLLRDHD